MASPDDPRLAMAVVRAHYNEPGRYSRIDAWHAYTAAEIRRQLANLWKYLSADDRNFVLNAGAGDSDLGLSSRIQVSLDISEARLVGLPRPVVGSIEALPFGSATIDTIVCVGSVVNYCDAAAAISEFGRTLRPAGYLALEFESSRSADLLPQAAFAESAAIADTFYAGQREAIWVYTLEYVVSLLHAAGFSVLQQIPIHVLSPWPLLIFRNEWIAARFAPLDRVSRNIRRLTRWASNYLLLCQKKPAM